MAFLFFTRRPGAQAPGAGVVRDSIEWDGDGARPAGHGTGSGGRLCLCAGEGEGAMAEWEPWKRIRQVRRVAIGTALIAVASYALPYLGGDPALYLSGDWGLGGVPELGWALELGGAPDFLTCCVSGFRLVFSLLAAPFVLPDRSAGITLFLTGLITYSGQFALCLAAAVALWRRRYQLCSHLAWINVISRGFLSLAGFVGLIPIQRGQFAFGWWLGLAACYICGDAAAWIKMRSP